MTRLKLPATLCVFCIYSLMMFSCTQNENQITHTLWYEKPAVEWTDALPVGNGRLGAMVFGYPGNERIQFNEESLWAGTRRNCNNPEALNYFGKVQQLLLNDKNNDALELSQKYLMGIPPRIRSYQTFGDVFLDFEFDTSSITSYKRWLDLNTGISETKFILNEVPLTREVFVSAPDNAIIIHVNSDDSNILNGLISMHRDQDAAITTIDEHTLAMEGQIMDEPDSQTGPGGAHMKFAAVLKVLNTDGTVSAANNNIQINDAGYLTLALTAATDYNVNILNFDRSIDPHAVCMDIMNNLAEKTYDDLKSVHVSDHQELFNRVSFQLGDVQPDTIPTDERLQRVIDGQTDDHLTALYFQYGRYLLMGSSRYPGTLPANLQGVWNHHFNAPWSSDYHTNINVQMNYWPAEICNLSETSIPYINFFNAYREPGRATAREMYDAKGWTMHHATNVFGRTAIQDAIRHGMFPLGAAWVCFPIWRHYEFTADTSYLKNTAWPIIREAILFINDFLIVSPEGYLVTAPSYSPENTFYLPGSKDEMRLTYGPTMDIMIIQELYKYALSAIETLEMNQEMRDDILNKMDSLPPIQISENGTIQEWVKDYDEVEPGHRHISHLLALHPGTQITEKDTALFEAARKTIDYRLSHGGGHTGWSRAWIINFYARLLDGDEAYRHLHLLLQKSTLKNLFDTHPPFQIDGNFGGTAGIAEMLLQSHQGYIHLLPALPSGWQKGKITGLKARGNVTVSMEWQKGALVFAEIIPWHSGKYKLSYNGRVAEIACKKGKAYRLDKDFTFN